MTSTAVMHGEGPEGPWYAQLDCQGVEPQWFGLNFLPEGGEERVQNLEGWADEKAAQFWEEQRRLRP